MDQVSTHGVVQSDPQNNADPKGIHTRSFFSDKDLSDEFFASLPFGEVRPFTFFESVPDDKRIRSQFINQVQSYTLKAPLMQAIHMKKLVCQVPREAILPFNWEKWFKNPVIGQDLNQVAPDAGTAVLGFWRLCYNLMSACKGSLPNSTTINSTATANAFVNAWFRYLLLAEMFYSDGNLLKYCRISGRPWAYSFKSDGHTHLSVDYVFDKFCSLFLEALDHSSTTMYTLTFGSGANAVSYSVDPSIDPNRTYPGYYISFRESLSLMRDDLNFSIDLGPMQSQPLGEIDDFRVAVTSDIEMDLVFKDDPASTQADLTPIDLKRLWSYQLCCAHFLTNDSVDFVYTAELFRQYIWNLVNKRSSTTGVNFTHMFVVNGYEYEYDYLSAHYFASVLDALTRFFTNAYPTSSNQFPQDAASCFGYLCALFGFKRSLRYLDYFTGSKTRPLAVGDVNVQVNSGLVNVVDTQAKTFLARFLNVINRVGMRNYVEGVFNVRQSPDWHNPQYLVKVDDIVTGQRVENTGSQQWDPDYPNSVTCTLHGNSDRFAFESDFDRSSVIIGLVWFDIDRVYSMATERQNLHYNRFDEFQPFMQYTGDQALYRIELGTPLTSGSVLLPKDAFGYKLRNAEYKERYPQCAGAFCTDMLDGYVFKADVLEASGIQNVGPSFIRSFPSELDRFYLSSTGFSLATYFHFIVRFASLYSGSRPMAYAPTLM